MREDFEGGAQLDPNHFRLEQHFVRVETDEGPIGMAGPLPDMVAAFVAKRLRPIILGQDPVAHEKAVRRMHRIMVHGRQGDAMLAISAIDGALWDLKGHWLGQPVYRLLGGSSNSARAGSRSAMPDRHRQLPPHQGAPAIPLSGAEHEYTRCGFKRFIDVGALDLLQPDIYCAGGLSEVLKIAAYASVHDLMVIPHGHSTPAGLHFSVVQSRHR